MSGETAGVARSSIRLPALPLFLTEGNKYPVGIAMFAFTTVIYLTSNHFPIYPPQLLRMTALDQALPYIPESFWVYFSEIPFFFAVYISMTPNARMNKFICAFTALQIASVLIFLAWPTTYPRAQFPTPAPGSTDAATYWLITALRFADTPANCFPSLHVSSTFLCAFAFLDDQRRKFPLFLTWAVIISISALTTKQHYVADAIGGIAMAGAAFWIFHRKARYRPQAGRQAKR